MWQSLKYVVIAVTLVLGFTLLLSYLNKLNVLNEPKLHDGENDICWGFWVSKTFCLGIKDKVFVN